MICILPNRGLGHTSFPIFLGIQGGSRCLACVETGVGPSLQLEVRDRTLFWGSLQTWPGLQGALASLCSSVGSGQVHTSLLFRFPPSFPAPSTQTLASRTFRGQFPGERATLSGPLLAKPQKPRGLTRNQQSNPAAAALPSQDVNIGDLYKGGDQATCFTFFQRCSDPAFRLEAAA